MVASIIVLHAVKNAKAFSRRTNHTSCRVSVSSDTVFCTLTYHFVVLLFFFFLSGMNSMHRAEGIERVRPDRLTVETGMETV